MRNACFSTEALKSDDFVTKKYQKGYFINWTEQMDGKKQRAGAVRIYLSPVGRHY